MSQGFQIKEGEKVIGIYRQYGLTYIGNIIIALILILIPFFFLTPLFTQGWLGIIIFAVLVILALWYILIKAIIWLGNKTIVTDQRLVDIERRKLFDRRVSIALYSSIVDVTHRTKGIFSTLFHYGTVGIKIADGKVDLELCRIKNPEELVDLLNELREAKVKYDTPETKE